MEATIAKIERKIEEMKKLLNSVQPTGQNEFLLREMRSTLNFLQVLRIELRAKLQKQTKINF